MNIFDSFMVAFGFQVDTEQIEKFEKKAEELKASALKLGAIFTGAAIGVGMFVEKATSSLAEMYEFAELNQVSARSIQAMTMAGVNFGIAGDSMRESLGALNRKLGEAAAGIGRGKMLFEKVGLHARDASGHVLTLNQMIAQLSDKMQGKSRAENIAIAERLGLDPKMVYLLEAGKDKIVELREEAEKMIPFSEEDYELAHKVEILFTKTNIALGVMTKQVAVKLLPAVQKALLWFNQWFKDMRSGTAGEFTRVLEGMTKVIGTLWDWILRLTSGVKSAWDYVKKFHWVLYLAGVAMGVLLAYKAGTFFLTLAEAVGSAAKALWAFDAAAALPAVLIGGIILAIALLVDELVNYYEGNETIIGQLQTKFKGAIYAAWAVLLLLIGGFIALKWTAITSMMETIAIVAMYAAEWIMAHAAMAVATLAAYWPILLIIAAILLVVGVIWYLWAHWDKVTALMRKAWTWVVDHIKAGIQWLIDKFEQLAVSSAKFIRSLPGGTKLLSFITGASEEQINGAIDKASGGPAAPGAVIGKAGTSISNSEASSTTTHVNAPITVVTSDPEKAGESVKKELNRTTREATRNGQSAVAL